METTTQTSQAPSFADKKQWFDEALKKLCYIGIYDAGLNDDDVKRWTSTVKTRSDADAAAREYAASYGLDMADDPWMP